MTPPAPASRSERRRTPRHGESGAALILAIFILAILLSLVVSMAASVRVDLKASRNYTEAIQADAIIDGAVAHAMVTLQNDTDPGEDSLTDDWATLGTTGTDTFSLGDGSYQIQILDASSRLNLNTATRDQLLTLPGVTDEIADAVIDWRDEDDTPGTSGAESDTYQGYPRPYDAKNAPYDTVDELLMVQGITPSLLYGLPNQASTEEDTSTNVSTLSGLADYLTVRSYENNLTAAGEARLNLSSVTDQQLQDLTTVTLTPQQRTAILQHRSQNQYRSPADLLDVRTVLPNGGGQGGQGGGLQFGPAAFTKEAVKGMIDLFTVSNAKTLEGRINVNTAPLEVLKTLPGMTDEAANNILSLRPFTSVGDLLDDSVMPESLFRGIVNNVSTKSSVFLVRVRAVARPNGGVHAAEALVERTANGMRLLRKKSVDRWPGWQSWGWGEPSEQAIGNRQ